MAVYTKKTFAEIELFLQNYQIGKLLEFKEIIEGIDNSNFFLATEKAKFILTIFEKRISPNDLPFFINFKQHLAKKNICCPAPISNIESEFITSFNDKKSLLVTFLEGSILKANQQGFYGEINKNHCQQIGTLTANLHLSAIDFKGYRENDLGYLGWQKLFDKIEKNLTDFDQNLSNEIKQNIDFAVANWSVKLPSAVCHLDIFPDNVFFDDNEKLSGVIDFYFAASDLLIYDLAIVINAWCFDEKNQFDKEKFLTILSSYQKIRTLTKEEFEFLDIALFSAAIRFVLTRFHDMFFSKKDSLVKIKNPQEFVEKMRFFKNHKISQFYE